jgi:hypothetical protein
VIDAKHPITVFTTTVLDAKHPITVFTCDPQSRHHR